MSILARSVPDDWYLESFDLARVEAPPDDVVAAEVDLALRLLGAREGERILDLACGMGRHAKELGRRGYETFGIDISPELIEIADGEAEIEGIDAARYERADLRELRPDPEYDVVLSLHGGAIGYFRGEEQNRRTFEVIAAALRPRGRHLAQLTNVRFVEQYLATRDWRLGEELVELIDQRWNAHTRCLEGESLILRDEALPFHYAAPVAFRRRLYTVAELRDLYASVGMRLVGVFDPEGTLDPRGAQADPSPEDPEIFVLAEKA
jgi:SAM-dependent methyltransferase